MAAFACSLVSSWSAILLLRAHSMLSETLVRLGQPGPAAEHLNLAYDILKDCPKDARYYTELMNIGVIFMIVDENQTGRIIEMLEPVAQFAIKEKLRLLAQYATHDLATNLEAEKKWDEALELNDEIVLALASYGIGCIMIFPDRLPEAQVYLRKSLRHYESKNRNHEAIISVYLSLLQIALTQKNVAESERLIRLIDSNGSQKDLSTHRRNLLEAKVPFYEMKKDWMAALETYRDLTAYYINFMQERDQELTNKYNAMFDLKRRENENQDLTLQNSLQAERLAAWEKFRSISIIVVGLSLGLLAVLPIVLRQSHEIKTSRIHMKRVLDNIDEAILILDARLMIRKGYSVQLEQILGRKKATFENQDLMELLFRGSPLSEDSIAVIRANLSCRVN